MSREKLSQSDQCLASGPSFRRFHKFFEMKIFVPQSNLFESFPQFCSQTVDENEIEVLVRGIKLFDNN